MLEQIGELHRVATEIDIECSVCNKWQPLSDVCCACGEKLCQIFIPKNLVCYYQKREAINNVIDECTAIIAKNYVRRDSLPTKEEIVNIVSRIDFTEDIAEEIIERINNGKS